MSTATAVAEGSMPYRTKPTLWSRFIGWVMGPKVADATLEPYRPRYTYSVGMEKPDARFHSIPGAVARKREAAARKARLK